MSARVLLGLGPFRFEVTRHAYEQLERRRGGRWVEVERLTRRPALQHLGAAKASVTLTATIYPETTGGLDQVDKMGSSAEDGEVHMMVGQEGSIGRVLGRWVIEELSDRQSYFTDEGLPRKVEVTITLAHYGDDGGERGGGLW